jgi:hypothetical protein
VGAWYESKIKAVARALRKIPHTREDFEDRTVFTYAQGSITLYRAKPAHP